MHLAAVAGLSLLLATSRPEAAEYATSTFLTEPGAVNGVNRNYAFVPAHPLSPARLVVFLPGDSGGAAGYTAFMKRAAAKGYYVVGLDWVADLDLVPLCSCNSKCADHELRQIVTGSVPTRSFYDVYFSSGGSVDAAKARYNSIVSRLVSFLVFLTANNDGDFQSFTIVDPATNTRAPDWSKIIPAGHSSGAGAATWILGHMADVPKALAFSGPGNYLNVDHAVQTNSLPCALPTPGYTGTAYTNAPLTCTPQAASPSFVPDSPSWASRLRIFDAQDDPRYQGQYVPAGIGGGRNIVANAVRLGLAQQWVDANTPPAGHWLTMASGAEGSASPHEATVTNWRRR